MRHISGPLSEIIDDLAKRSATVEHDPVRRLRREDLDAQALYLQLTDLRDAAALEIGELTRRKAVIDTIRGAIALGGGE